MKSIIYDTSAMYSSSFLIKDRQLIDTILNNDEYLQTEFMTPQVVLDEILNKLKEEIKSINADYNSTKKKCLQFIKEKELDQIMPQDHLISENFYIQLIDRLKIHIENIGQILPYPKIQHKDIVHRALSRKKPFDTKGENGYRDTLIWETIKTVAATSVYDTDIIFICHNPRDFFDMDKWKKNIVELDNNLLKELESIPYNKERLRCYTSLSKFCDKEILPYLTDLEELKPSIIEPDFCKLLEPYIKDNLFNESDFTKEIDYVFDNIDINYVGLIQIIQVLESRKINETTAMIKVECEVEYNIDVYVFKADYYGDAETIGGVIDWNDHYFQKEISDYIYPEILITYDLKSDKILSVNKYE